jgi:hypothetical protein
MFISNWNRRPPRHPIIAYEWAHPGTEQRRIVRRERWASGGNVDYETRTGNAWLFGEENSTTAIGYCFVTAAQHIVELPKPPKDRREGFLVPFNLNVRLVEFMPGTSRYPDGGVNLGEA